MTGNSDNDAVRYQEGKPGSHQLNDPSRLEDERSIANRLAAEEVCIPTLDLLRQLTAGQMQGEPQDDAETAALKKDPTLPARMHGNEPSRGAKIDAQIAAEEEEELKRKGKA
ncbi:hypothetical protein E4U43_008636 [Claviceps pusilla]|uniref:Uncharacterized protein n=1 Tax=Claviceps pusilla TaxID=123648 RepID=A0A9P7NGF3_9HYPO|nr:hypothetical protein E4U43_008636 [Claviceps pusilla]